MKLLGIMLIASVGLVGWHAATQPQPPSVAYLAAARTAAQVAYVECLQQRGDLTETQCSQVAWSSAYRDYPKAKPATVAAPMSAPSVTLASSFAALEKESAQTRACVANIRNC